jgi:hypothetical protein
MQKIKKRKIGKTQPLLLMLLACLYFLNFAWISCVAEESIEYKETIEVMAFIATFPGELDFTKNTWLTFENMRTGPPINTSIKALNDKFIALQYSFTTAGSKFFVSFDIFYESTIDNETANSYADKIEEEFFKIFGYSGLKSVLGGRVLTITKENEKKIIESFGYVPLTYETVSSFLRFAPKNGFGKFIDGLVQKYVPPSTIHAEYWLKKIGSDFYWNVKVLGETSEILPWDVKDYSSTMSLKELLNTQSPIIAQPSQNQRIVILIQENTTMQLSKGLTMYSINIESIQPEGYTISPSDWPNWVEIRYEPLPPIENVEIKASINSSIPTSSDQDVRAIVEAATVAFALVIIALAVLRLKKKVKGGENLGRKDFQKGIEHHLSKLPNGPNAFFQCLSVRKLHATTESIYSKLCEDSGS